MEASGGGFLLEARRGKIDIMQKVLSTAVKGVGKTEIVYRANLNFTLAERYITMLLEEGLLNRVEGSKAIYTTTDKGLRFLKAYKDLKGVANL